MLEKVTEIEWRMESGMVLSLDEAAGCELVCRAGRLWLTETGGDDIWLGRGERHRLRRAGRTVIEAAVPSRVGLRRVTATGSLWHRWRGLLAGLLRRPPGTAGRLDPAGFSRP